MAALGNAQGPAPFSTTPPLATPPVIMTPWVPMQLLGSGFYPPAFETGGTGEVPTVGQIWPRW